MLIGVLALQGDYGTHADAIRKIGHETVEVRRPEDAGFANPTVPRYRAKAAAQSGPRAEVRGTGDVDTASMESGSVVSDDSSKHRPPTRRSLLTEADHAVALRPVPDGLILPGGESSTIDLLGRRYGLDFLMKAFAASGKTLFGTCAGAIWLGMGEHHKVRPLGIVDVTVERNAYGRQIDSFITPLEIQGLDSPFEAVFIRAPKITRVGLDVEVLAEHDGLPVLVRQGNVWLATFHPERTADRRLHQLIFSR